jgi:hypothetical protein
VNKKSHENSYPQDENSYIFKHGDQVGVIGGIDGDGSAVVATVIIDAHQSDDTIMLSPHSPGDLGTIEEVPKEAVFPLNQIDPEPT